MDIGKKFATYNAWKEALPPQPPVEASVLNRLGDERHAYLLTPLAIKVSYGAAYLEYLVKPPGRQPKLHHGLMEQGVGLVP